MSEAPSVPYSQHLLRLTMRTRWEPGQLGFHPDTQVVGGCGALGREDAEQWAMMQCTWRGAAWWYGWARLELDDETRVIEGWLLVPRDPREVMNG